MLVPDIFHIEKLCDRGTCKTGKSGFIQIIGLPIKELVSALNRFFW